MRKIFTIYLIFSISLLAGKKDDTSIDLQFLDNSKEIKAYEEALRKSYNGEISSEEFYEIADEYFYSLKEIKGKIPGRKPYERAKYKYADKKANIDKPNFNSIYQEFKKFESKDVTQLLAVDEWKEKGPFRTPQLRSGAPSTLGTGRLNSVEIDPNNSNVIWAGAAGGGIWKSTDRGESWQVFEDTEFASLGISDIAIAFDNSNIVYAASGDKNTWFSGGGDVRYYSAGIFKTINGGNTWEVLSPLNNNSTSQRNFITDIEVSPSDDNLVFVSSSEGLYRSTNGGADWTRITGGYFTDMKINLGNNNLIHLSRWSGNQNILSTYNNSTDEFYGEFPVNSATRGEIALTQDDTDVVYVLLSASSLFGAIVKSENNGESWQVERTLNDGVNYMGLFDGTGGDFQQGQGLYDLCIEVNPNDADDLVIGGINLWRSTNGGSSFNRITSWWEFNANPPFIHADQHELEWDRNGDLFSATDGGLYVTENNGNSWRDLNTGLHITQFYRFSSSQQNDEIIIGGSQDNSTWVYDNGNWFDAGLGGDGFHCLINPENDDIQFASQNVAGVQGTVGTRVTLSNNKGRNFGEFFRSTQFGEVSQWIAPFELDPNNTDDLYVGFNNLYRINDLNLNTIDRLTEFGAPSNSTIRQIAISPIDENNIWFSIDGRCYYTSNGGQNWDVIFNGNRVITDIEASVKNSDEAYITLTGFSNGQKVYKLSGTNAENITFNLPNISAYSIVQIPNSEELFVGMDIGVYRKTENGTVWNLFSKGLTRSGISELEYQKSSQLLRASTYGRGIWEVELVDCDIEQPVLIADEEETLEVNLCEGEEIELGYIGDYDRVEWNTGELKRFITVNEPGEYYVIAEDENGCSTRSETMVVNFDEFPEVNINFSGTVELCEGDSIRAIVFGFFEEYEWSNGVTERANWIKEPGEYYLTAREGKALCEGVSESFEVVIVDKPKIPEITVENDILITDIIDGEIQWFRNDEEIEGATSSEFEPLTDGEYYVEVTNSAGCSSKSDLVNVTWFSVSEGKERGFKVSPNPTSGVINIEYNGIKPGNSRIEIINSIGKVIVQEEFFAESNQYSDTFDLSKFPQGVYFITLWNKGIQVTQKIVLN